MHTCLLFIPGAVGWLLFGVGILVVTIGVVVVIMFNVAEYNPNTIYVM